MCVCVSVCVCVFVCVCVCVCVYVCAFACTCVTKIVVLPIVATKTDTLCRRHITGIHHFVPLC